MCQQLIIHRRWVATWCRNWRCLFCWPAFISTFEQSYLSGHCHTEVSLQVWFKWMRGRIRSFSRYVLFCTPIRFTVCNLSVLVDRCLFRHGEWLRYEFCIDALEAAVSSTAGVFFAAVTLILADVRWNQQGNKFAYTGWPNKKSHHRMFSFDGKVFLACWNLFWSGGSYCVFCYQHILHDIPCGSVLVLGLLVWMSVAALKWSSFFRKQVTDGNCTDALLNLLEYGILTGSLLFRSHTHYSFVNSCFRVSFTCLIILHEFSQCWILPTLPKLWLSLPQYLSISPALLHK